MWSCIAMVASFAVTVYAQVIAAFAGHHTQVDANGGLAALDHPAGWFDAVVIRVFGVIQRALEPAHVSLSTNNRS